KDYDDELAKARVEFNGEVDLLKNKHAEDCALLAKDARNLTRARNCAIVTLCKARRDLVITPEENTI
ncbi:hypothetical protein A2U01_0091425, partial [Trifolium medium]|nr:hypothetical protein [Trifolium medium]